MLPDQIRLARAMEHAFSEESYDAYRKYERKPTKANRRAYEKICEVEARLKKAIAIWRKNGGDLIMALHENFRYTERVEARYRFDELAFLIHRALQRFDLNATKYPITELHLKRVREEMPAWLEMLEENGHRDLYRRLRLELAQNLVEMSVNPPTTVQETSGLLRTLERIDRQLAVLRL